MKKLLGVVGFLLVSSVSWAGLDGQWSGWGDWNFQGSGTHCSAVNMSFKENATSLQRVSGSFGCDVADLTLPSGEWTISGENLLVDGQVVGSVKNNIYQWTEIYSPTVKVNVQITVDGTHLDYLENWISSDSGPLYDIHARLFVKQN